jgi:hypothetical protein
VDKIEETCFVKKDVHMKKNAFLQFVLLIIMCFFLVGCAPKYQQEDTLIPISTSTELATLIITPIGTPTFIATPIMVEATPVHTMTSEEQKDFVKEFLSNSGDCKLPCWWNITPGQTWVDAEKTIQSFGGALVPVFPGYDPETTVYGTSIGLNNLIPGANIYIEEKEGLVYAWHISSDWERVNPEEFGYFWKNYSAQKIIKAYGMPDRILLHGRSTNSFYYGRNYELWLFYDELGFSILYEPLIPEYFSSAPFFRICSETDALIGIEFNMQVSSNPLPLDRFDQTLEEVRLGTEIGKSFMIRPLQEATGMNDEELYEAFMQEKDPCLAIPSDIWHVK